MPVVVMLYGAEQWLNASTPNRSLQELQTMVGYSNTATGIRALKRVVQQERPIFLVFSGGGNDIVGSELKGSILPFHPL